MPLHALGVAQQPFVAEVVSPLGEAGDEPVLDRGKFASPGTAIRGARDTAVLDPRVPGLDVAPPVALKGDVTPRTGSWLSRMTPVPLSGPPSGPLISPSKTTCPFS